MDDLRDDTGSSVRDCDFGTWKAETVPNPGSGVFLDKIDRRIAAFDLAAAHEAGNLMALRRKKGRPVELRDTMIAGIALAQRAALATRNTVHFNEFPLRL